MYARVADSLSERRQRQVEKYKSIEPNQKSYKHSGNLLVSIKTILLIS